MYGQGVGRRGLHICFQVILLPYCSLLCAVGQGLSWSLDDSCLGSLDLVPCDNLGLHS